MVPPLLRHWALWASACLVALGMLIPRAAWAQTCPSVSISQNPTVNRYNPGADTVANQFPVRAQNLDPTAINYTDCIADIHLHFDLIVSGLPCTDTMQVWAGTTDCTQTSARESNSGATQCWRIGPSVALQQAFPIDIRAQDLVAFVSTAEPPPGYTPQGSAACHAQVAPGTVSVGVYFMAMEADGLTVDGTPAMYSLDVDLVGPYPPTGVTAGVGENLIVVNWTPAVDSTIEGFNVYCQDQGANGGDAGLLEAEVPEATLVCPAGVTATTDGATDATATTDMDACVFVNVTGTNSPGGSVCVSNALIDSYCLVNGVVSTAASCESVTVTGVDAGEDAIVDTVETDASAEASVPAGTAVGISNIPSIYLCGQVGGNTTSSFTVLGFADGGAPIKDFTQYAVGVAAFDGTGNTGIISSLSCVTPAPVITFWDQYLADGGRGGGGFCALEGAGIPIGGSLFGGGMGVAVLAYARRRRRSR